MPGGRTRVYIDATAEQLEREILKAERALERLGREGAENGVQASRGMDKATAATSRYARAASAASTVTSRVGSAARTAAPYVAGGLALGLAKSVIEYREAEKAGAQTEAVIKSTGGAANVTAKEIANLSEALSEKVGMDDEAIQSGANLLLTFTNIRNEAGKNNDVFSQSTSLITDMSVALGTDLKSAALQLGKALNDPASGLTALRRSGVAFDEQQQEQIKTLFASGQQLKAQKLILAEVTKEFGGSAKAQADSFDKLQVSAENFAESIGGEITPTLSDMADELSEILSDKHLTADQRVDRLGDFFEEWAGKGIDALEDAAPEIAHTGAEIAKDMIGAFANAWWDSDLLGKLFLGSAALRLFGGPGVFGKLGGAMATRVLGGMNTTMAAPPATTSARLSGRTVGMAAGAGMVLGLALEGPAIVKQIEKIIGGTELGDTDRESFAAKVEEYFGAPEGSADFLGKWKVKLDTDVGKLIFDSRTGKVISAKGKLLRRAIGDSYGEAFQVVEDIKSGKIAEKVGFDELLEGLDKSGSRAKKNGRLLQDYFDGLSKNLKQASRDTNSHKTVFDRAMDAIGGDLRQGAVDVDSFVQGWGRSLDRGKSKARSFEDGVGASYRNTSWIGGKALGVLAENTSNFLTGVDQKPLDFTLKDVAKGKSPFQRGGAVRLQGGGDVFQVPGNGTGDSFHTVVPDGTFILNRNAVNEFFGLQRGGPVPVVLEPGELAFSPAAVAQMGGFLQWANDAAPRFASGGSVAMPGTGVQRSYPGVSGDTDFIPALGNALSRMAKGTGQSISVQSGFRTYAEQAALQGGPNPAAAPGTSHHEYGYAADITPGNSVFGGVAGKYGLTFPLLGIGEPWHIELANPNSPAAKAVAAAAIKRQVVDGPDGKLKDLSQAALDKAWKGAKDYVNKKQPAGAGDGPVSFPKGGGPPADIKNLPKDLQKYNYTWKAGPTIPEGAVSEGLSWVGLPVDTFLRIIRGESGFQPGAIGDDAAAGYGHTFGYGLTQITTGYSDADVQAATGGTDYNDMLNPWLNLMAARHKYDAAGGLSPWAGSHYLQRGGLGAWYGQRYVTDTNAHYSGPLLGKQRGGYVGMASGGKAKPTKGEFAPGPATPPPAFGPALPSFPGAKAPKMSYEQQMTFFGIGLTYAQETTTTEDDLAILQAQLALVQGETDRVTGELADLHLTGKDKDKARKQAVAATAAMRKKFIKDGELSSKEQRRLEAAEAAEMKKAGQKILDTRRGELLDQLSGLTGELSSTKDSIESLNEEATESLAELVESMKSLADEMAEHNRLLSQETTTQRTELIRALADLMDGEIGGRVDAYSNTAGYGQVVAA